MWQARNYLIYCPKESTRKNKVQVPIQLIKKRMIYNSVDHFEWRLSTSSLITGAFYGLFFHAVIMHLSSAALKYYK